MELGVVIERRGSANKWLDFEHEVIAVVPGAKPMNPVDDDWRLLEQGDGFERFHAGTLTLELFKGETGGYKVNLSNFRPHVYVVLSPGEEAEDPDLFPTLVTVCPFEAERYTEDSEQMVEGVPMPPEIAGWLQAFCDAFHKDVPFVKRKRKPYDPRKGGFRRHGGGGGMAD